MKIDYDVGDVVVCTQDDADGPDGCPLQPIYKGDIRRCAVLIECPINGIGVSFEGHASPKWFYYAERFRKLPKADTGFTSLIKRRAAPKRVPENA